jgi:hypothetical protein
MNNLFALTAGIMLLNSAMLGQSNTLRLPSVDLRSWVQSSRPVVQSKLLFYSDGKFAYKVTVKDSAGGVVLDFCNFRTVNCSVCWGHLKPAHSSRILIPAFWWATLRSESMVKMNI